MKAIKLNNEQKINQLKLIMKDQGDRTIFKSKKIAENEFCPKFVKVKLAISQCHIKLKKINFQQKTLKEKTKK